MRSALSPLLVMAAGCGSASEYTDAAVQTGITAAGAVVNREITNECYAACSYDTYCNRETGFCEPRKNAPPGALPARQPSPRCAEAIRRHEEMRQLYPETHATVIDARAAVDACDAD